MSNSKIIKEFQLSNGKKFYLHHIQKDLIPFYYLLSFPKKLGEPTPSEVSEMLQRGTAIAQDLAFQQFSDKEAFSILYSGYSARREKGWHVHIVLLGNRWRKGWLHLVLAGKNFLQAFGLCKDSSKKKSQ